MTREEAIDWLARVKSNTVNHILEMPLWWNEPLAEALEMAIKALEQEPRKGHWIEGQTDNPKIHNILCSCCFEGYPSKGHANSQYTKKKFQYCPNCGAEMESEE